MFKKKKQEPQAGPCSDCAALAERVEKLEKRWDHERDYARWKANNASSGGSFGFEATPTHVSKSALRNFG